MNQPSQPTEAMFEQATLWHVRLGERLLDASLQEAHRQWLAADPLHAEAWAQTLLLWGKLAEPVAQVQAEQRVSRRRARPLARLAIAACLVASATLALVWQHGALDGLTSDFHTALGERQSLTLADGSHIELNTRSAIDVQFDQGTRRVRLLRGEAWFEVRKDVSRPFVVALPSGQVTVTGTHFNVRLDEQGAVVSLVEGRVELDQGAEHAVLEPGQQRRVSAGGIGSAASFDRLSVEAWRQGQLVFFRTPLKNVIAELERYHRQHIFIGNAELAQLQVSGVFAMNDPQAVLQALHDTLGIQVSELGLGIVVLR